MTHSVPVTFSPSSFTMTRSTPCVDGCCGPMLRTSSVESRKVWAMGLLSALNAEVFLHPAVVHLNNVVVLAQRMALPLVGHENALQTGMVGKLDAEHVEDFALQPVGGEMDVDHTA